MISVVITAAGNSTRFGENKLLLEIAGKPMIVRTVEQFSKCSKLDEMIVATRKQDIPLYQELFNRHNLSVLVVEGGSERIESVYKGVKASKGNIILTHDGARALTPVWLIENLIKAVEEYGAAMTAVPPTATIKYAEDDLIIQRSLARATTWIAQTPQGFKRDILLSALESAINDQYFVATDDSEIVAMYGHKVKIVAGDFINMKVTVKSDLVIANELFSQSLSS
ncbi:MAG: 2-C-methyl-D-erythritol 4-phosphate cytidylyltransferase [Chlamydiae bacterium]|nr:2-C-methyl-D-erythritol 4-phosphate cytidylyltransferase [Chlamydiota bacterium]